MAGDWIKMRSDLFTHPKVFKIADELGKDELYVVGALLAFWAWAHSHAVDGRVDGATSNLVDKATRAPGLSAALVSVGWLEVDGTGITIPRFDVHNSDSAKERALKNERQARWRERKNTGLVDEKPSTQASTKPSTREEKRREDTSSLRSEVEAPRKRVAAPQVDRPADVAEQTWTDWLSLRKAKKAPVTKTVLAHAELEAHKAGMPLDAFLQVWCARGSQGLQASWLKPSERETPSRMSFAQQDELARRRRWEEMTGRKWPTDGADAIDVTPKTLGVAA